MITIKTLIYSFFGNYKNHYKPCAYIIEQEKLRLLTSNPNLRKLQWSFTVYTPGCKPWKGRDGQGYHPTSLPVVEICTGDNRMRRYAILTPEVDVHDLKAQWCRAFCSAHDLVL